MFDSPKNKYITHSIFCNCGTYILYTSNDCIGVHLMLAVDTFVYFMFGQMDPFSFSINSNFCL